MELPTLHLVPTAPSPAAGQHEKSLAPSAWLPPTRHWWASVTLPFGLLQAECPTSAILPSQQRCSRHGVTRTPCTPWRDGSWWLGRCWERKRWEVLPFILFSWICQLSALWGSFYLHLKEQRHYRLLCLCWLRSVLWFCQWHRIPKSELLSIVS